MGDVVSMIRRARGLGMRRGVSAVAWYERGCAVEAVDPAAARVAYERALAGRPDFADAHNNLGRLQHDAGELHAAETSYRLAICSSGAAASGGGIGLYWFNLGVALEDQHRYAEAIAAYEQALVLDDGCADAHFNLARLCEHLGRSRHDGALLMYRAVRHLLRYRRLVRSG
jgi:tetratricopeptide (TPR) repeat protein